MRGPRGTSLVLDPVRTGKSGKPPESLSHAGYVRETSTLPSKASLEELAQIMSRCQSLVTADVLVFQPRDAGLEWTKTDLWRTARAIPGVRATADENGRERRRFGVLTSGHALLYDPAGKLIFSGGMTASRGQTGENTGRNALVQLLTQGHADLDRTSVFGCPLAKPCPSEELCPSEEPEAL